MQRLIRSATYYCYDDKPETFYYADVQYGAFITTVTIHMVQTIKPILLRHLGVKSQTLAHLPEICDGNTIVAQ